MLASLALVGEAFIFATRKDDSDALHTQAIRSDCRVYAPPLPDSLSFCGERVPLNLYYVRESLDRELVSNMYYQSNTLFYIKRAARVFPVIEPILRQEGVPDDMKYLCVAESGLQCVSSPAGAQGWWQFMKPTALQYGLEVGDDIDMRNHLEASTRAACRFLKNLKSRLGGWPEAAAAYNCGEGGLNRQLSSQRQDSYYELLLNSETQRYVYRILAIKLIMQHPQDYGFFVRHCDTYATPLTEEVELSGQNVDLVSFATEHGTTYKVLRMLNPWLTSSTLRNKLGKTYMVSVPVKKGTEYNTMVRGKHDTTLIEKL